MKRWRVFCCALGLLALSALCLPRPQAGTPTRTWLVFVATQGGGAGVGYLYPDKAHALAAAEVLADPSQAQGVWVNVRDGQDRFAPYLAWTPESGWSDPPPEPRR